MSPCGQRVLPFAGQVVGVEWSGERARQATELAFGADAAEDGRLPDVVLRIGARADSPMLTLFHDRTCLYRGDRLGTATHLLIQASLDSLIQRSTGGLVLHAALLAHGDHGVLLPGATGSGKSMLSAWLGLRGFDHLSDEACYLPDGASQLEGFARPFCFKGPWIDPLGLAERALEPVLQDDAVSLVAPELIAVTQRRGAVRPRLIIFPHYAAEAAFELTRLTPARAAVRLMESVANARNLAEHGVDRVTELVQRVEAFALRYGRCEQLEPVRAQIAALG